MKTSMAGGVKISAQGKYNFSDFYLSTKWKLYVFVMLKLKEFQSSTSMISSFFCPNLGAIAL